LCQGTGAGVQAPRRNAAAALAQFALLLAEYGHRWHLGWHAAIDIFKIKPANTHSNRIKLLNKEQIATESSTGPLYSQVPNAASN